MQRIICTINIQQVFSSCYMQISWILSKYFHSANDTLHAWICSQGLWKSIREKWTGNLTNCFELCFSAKYFWCHEIACQRIAEPMISNYWEIVALNQTIEVMKLLWQSQVKCRCRNYIEFTFEGHCAIFYNPVVVLWFIHVWLVTLSIWTSFINVGSYSYTYMYIFLFVWWSI